MECSLYPVTWAPSMSGSSGVSTFDSASVQDRRLEVGYHPGKISDQEMFVIHLLGKGLFWSLYTANIRFLIQQLQGNCSKGERAQSVVIIHVQTDRFCVWTLG